MQIKSKESTDSANSNAFAVICSQDRTYQIRQQQTSNSIYLVTPRPTTLENGSSVDGVSSTALFGSSLELSASKEIAEPYLRATLLPYIGNIEMELDGVSKHVVYSNIPLSTVEIDRYWISLCAFEELGSSYLPTPSALLAAWKAIYETAYAENLLVTDASQRDQLWKAISGEEIPAGLFEAIMSKVENSGFCLWLANLVLQAQAGNSMMRKDFSNYLTELVPKGIEIPEAFEAFEGFADLSNPVSITLKSSQVASAKKASSRKTWHDRLKKK